MTIKGSGLLAIWSTVEAGFETDYLHWLTREHVFERVGVPGFCSGRVLRRRGSDPAEYLILYELQDAQVMSSAAYQERLNQPTPWTQRVMPDLQYFRRGGGTILHQSGHAHAFGSRIAVARCEDGLPPALQGAASQATWNDLAGIDRVVNTYAMEVAAQGTQIATREKSMRRGGEGMFSGILVLEALDDGALQRAVEVASGGFAMAAGQFDTYDLVFAYSAPQAS